MQIRIPNRLRLYLLARCLRITSSREPDVRIGGSQEDPYMRRHWVLPRNFWFNIYIHEIRHDDDDRAEHDHPAWSISLILDVGYNELMKGISHIRTAGDVIFRLAKTHHRLEVLKNADGTVRPAITIFISGPKFHNWGFYCPGFFRKYQDFLDGDYNTGAVSKAGRGCGD